MRFIISVVIMALVFAEVRVRVQALHLGLKAAALCALAHMLRPPNWVVMWYCLSNGRCIMGRSCHIRFGLVLKSSLT